MRQTACLVVNPIIVDGYASLFNCTTAVRASDLMTASSKNFNQWVGAWRYVFGLARRGLTIGFHLLWHTVALAMSTRLYYNDWFDFYVFAFMHWLSREPLCKPKFMCFCIKSSIGTQGEVS